MNRTEIDPHLILDGAPALICSGRPDGNLDYCNRRLLVELGVSFEALAGHAWKRLVHPDDLSEHLGRLKAAVSGGEPISLEARVRGSSGEYLWMLHRIQPVRDEQGNVVRWFASSVDDSEARIAEETLRSAERELRTILETIPAFVWTADARGAIEFVTRRWVSHVGEEAAALGWEWTKRIHPDDRAQVLETWRSAVASGEPYDQEFRLAHSEGTYRWVLARAVALRDSDGTIARWYGTLTDIEDRKRTEEELQRLKDRLYRENIALRDEVSQTSMFEEIVGSSEPLRKVLGLVGKVAGTDSTVLITGETGTGKELVARAIHKRSTRASRPFVSVNCGAIPPSLINSELFGHEKGAFTGAMQRHLGRFELADGGTLFLDEVGELPAETQVALLRVLQERTFERVGGNRTIPADVRVIAATNRDLDQAIEEGSFRRDLFYRLSVFPIAVPPLRERAEDIPLLVEYLTQRYAAKAGKKIANVSRRSLELLTAYGWPGNVRELQNVIQRAVILCEGTLEVDSTWLAAEPSRPPAAERRLARPNAREERQIIEEALAAARGRVAGSDGAAARLGIPRSTLESRIRSLQINKNRFKTL